MTRDELDAATDEQLNEMAAKVMGWFVHHRNTALYYPADYTISTKPARFISEWRPSTSIADAWELGDKMGISVIKSEDGWYAIRAHDITHGCVRGTDHPTITLIGREGEQFVCHENKCRAITTAALLAWEAKEKA